MAKRVLLAGLFHETHTFLSGRMGLSEFEIRVGGELLTAEGDGSPLAGVLSVACDAGWEVIPVIDLRATPGPTVADEVVERFWQEFVAAVDRERARGIDGVYLVLHGAMVSESCLDVEGELLERIRQLLGESIPVCGVLDLHGNISERTAQFSHGFVAYRENPHADACQAAKDGALLLDRLLRTGERPVTVWEHPPLMWPPPGTGTAFEPMRSLEAAAREIERAHRDILAVNVFGGFSFADTPDTGVSFTATTVGDPEVACRELRRLSDLAWQLRERGLVREETLESVIATLKRDDSPSTTQRGPIVIAEPSDNIGGGAPGDGTALLRAFVEHAIPNCAVAINDPAAVAALRDVATGGRVTLEIGGRGSPLSSGPVRLEVEFVSRSDGQFELEDKQSHLASMCGSYFDMGPCAVVRHGEVTILLTSRKTPPFDLGQWRSQGIEPEKLFAIGVKAAVAHRRVYDRIASQHITVDTPGPCSSRLERFPFRHVRRPIFPLDP
ncbi:MAG: M81 family metallopeptidase [Planctomycetales bacterium]|nr:M81 family metallopeptidase [Planctomycetales bacterium]